MYGRDPRKLFETYQEEWDRLERLSDKRCVLFVCVLLVYWIDPRMIEQRRKGKHAVEFHVVFQACF